ncbi:MAG: bifunctional phosphoribosylaminoimidazolecarboxamide formyltransferase/IMP cyclohydrolase [Candidatus Pelagibacterales bacterium]|nr:MAG: bifunctional phosphoribosylaminoimidazolecarboxamide formyltransferase/IMP cyclohydrolase [Pelagibacterales bacterium]
MRENFIMKKLIKIKKAIISLSDKSNLKIILTNLKKFNIKIISSGGTYKEIKKLGFKCEEISNYTGFKEMLDGRVKTLHPKIHAGLLSIRNNKKHIKELKNNNFEEIDLVIVNFYPFEKSINETKNFKKIIEKIDIGGPTMVRAAAKNFNSVTVISSPNQYEDLINELKLNKGSTSINFRYKSALHSFNEIAYYDSVISNFLNHSSNLSFPEKKTFHGKLSEKLRYGENPHQIASFYKGSEFNSLKQLHGKKLSYNNYNDIFSSLEVLSTFQKNLGTVIVKHANPCGVSSEKKSIISFSHAFNCDPISAFGGIVCCNYKIDFNLAKKINQNFFEIIIAKGFEKRALKILKNKKNLRIIDSSNYKYKAIFNPVFHRDSFLLQNIDSFKIIEKDLKFVSKIKPNKYQIQNLIFALNVCRYVKSNAIVLVKNKSTIGIGSGQPNRLDSCNIAINKAKQFVPNELYNSVAASDAFFPFTDGIEKLVQSGVKAIIQPSGSIRDKEIIKFANDTNTILVFSKTRHFKH